MVKLFWMLGVVASLYAQERLPADYYAMKKIAYGYFDHGKSAQAIEYVKKYLAAHPQNNRAKNLLAHFYYWSGKKTAAKKLLEEVVAKSDLKEAKKLLAYLNRGKRKRGEEIEEDIAFLQRYVQTHPVDIESRKYLLNYYLSLNARDKARKMAAEILSIDPDEIETIEQLLEAGVEIPGYHSAADADATAIYSAFLEKFYLQKAWYRFLNFYRALEHRGVPLPEKVHRQALETALFLKRYRYAKKILLLHTRSGDQTVTALKSLVDRKLAKAG